MAMAGNRKKGDYSVLSEVNTEEEWNSLLERKVRRLSVLSGSPAVIKKSLG